MQRKTRMGFGAVRAGMILVFLIAQWTVVLDAQALVTVRFAAVDTFGGVGDTVEIDVFASNDGADTLTAIFLSAQWDPDILEFQEATDPPAFLFLGPTGLLTSVGPPRSLPGDPDGTLRTVEYLAAPGQRGSASDEVLITRLTFLGVGIGAVDVDVTRLLGDGVFGFGGSVLPDSSVCLIGVSLNPIAGPAVGIENRSSGCPPVPEPGTGLLTGFGLALLAARRRYRPAPVCS